MLILVGLIWMFCFTCLIDKLDSGVLLDLWFLVIVLLTYVSILLRVSCLIAFAYYCLLLYIVVYCFVVGRSFTVDIDVVIVLLAVALFALFI